VWLGWPRYLLALVPPAASAPRPGSCVSGRISSLADALPRGHLSRFGLAESSALCAFEAIPVPDGPARFLLRSRWQSRLSPGSWLAVGWLLDVRDAPALSNEPRAEMVTWLPVMSAGCLLFCRWASPGQRLLIASTGRSLALLD